MLSQSMSQSNQKYQVHFPAFIQKFGRLALIFMPISPAAKHFSSMLLYMGTKVFQESWVSHNPASARAIVADLTRIGFISEVNEMSEVIDL